MSHESSPEGQNQNSALCPSSSPDTFSLNILSKRDKKTDLTLGAERCGGLNRTVDAAYTTPERMQANQRQDSRDLAAMFFCVSAQCGGSDRLLSSSVAVAESQGSSSCSAAPAGFTFPPPARCCCDPPDAATSPRPRAESGTANLCGLPPSLSPSLP